MVVKALVAEGARLNMRLERLSQATAALAAARAWARAARAATTLGPDGQPSQRLPFEQARPSRPLQLLFYRLPYLNGKLGDQLVP